MSKMKQAMIVAGLMLSAITATANNFRAADLIYIPIAAKASGAFGSQFSTDVWITNVDTRAGRVQVHVAFAPSGTAPIDPNLTVNATPLVTLTAGQNVELLDIMQTINKTGGGQLLFFGCVEGGNCAEPVTVTGAANPDLRNIVVQSRVLTTQTGGGCPGNVAICTFGQNIPGMPWYHVASIDAAAKGLQRVLINGIRQNDEYRTTIFIANASQFSTADMVLRVFNAAGGEVSVTPFTLGPLQSTAQNIAGKATGTGFYAYVEQTRATPNAGVPENESAPGFFAIGSVLDNRTNDATTLESQFAPSLTSAEIACIYTAKPLRRGSKRRL